MQIILKISADKLLHGMIAQDLLHNMKCFQRHPFSVRDIYAKQLPLLALEKFPRGGHLSLDLHIQYP